MEWLNNIFLQFKELFKPETVDWSYIAGAFNLADGCDIVSHLTAWLPPADSSMQKFAIFYASVAIAGLLFNFFIDPPEKK